MINLNSVRTALSEWLESHSRDNDWAETDVRNLVKDIDAREVRFVERSDIWELVSPDGTGVHPSRVKMSELAREYRKLVEIYHEELRNTKEPDPIWKWSVQLSMSGSVHLVATLQNMAEYDEFLTYYGQVSRPDRSRSSVEYRYVHVSNVGERDLGYIAHDGGGWMLLKDELVVYHDEWQHMITTGVVPREWQRED